MNTLINWVIRHVKALVLTTGLVLLGSGLLFWNPIIHIWSVPPVVTTYADDHRTDLTNMALIVDHILSPGTCFDIVEGDKLIKTHDTLDCQVWFQMLHKYYKSREQGITDSEFEISLLEKVTPTSNQQVDHLAYSKKQSDQALWDQAKTLFKQGQKGQNNDTAH